LKTVKAKDELIEWLLEGDAAIRWQVCRDLLSATQRKVANERAKVAHSGWGGRLLSIQDPEGSWAGGASSDAGMYSPKWTSTTYTMLLLRDFGLPKNNRQAKKACHLLLERGLQADGGVSYGTWAKWTHRGETCISGMVLSILSHFEHDDPRMETIASHLLVEQMPDGGWNSAAKRRHSFLSPHHYKCPRRAAMVRIAAPQ
jgi:hypothetical protein